MLTKNVFAAGALLSLAVAVPLQQQNKRDIIYQTKTIEEVVTVDVTTTIFLNPGETPPSHYGHGHQPHKPKVTSHIRHTVTVQPSPSSPAEQSPESSPYVPPSPSTPAAPATTPPAAPTKQPPPPPPPQPSPTHGGGSGTSPHGATYTGDITYYTPGLGSCGTTSTDSDAIVALAEGMMMAQDNGNPNTNPLCGSSITISYGGVTQQATIVDTCPGCSGASLDLSPTLFQAFASLGTGRVSGVEWWYN